MWSVRFLGFVQTKCLQMEAYSFQSKLFIEWKLCRQHDSQMFYTWSTQRSQLTYHTIFFLLFFFFYKGLVVSVHDPRFRFIIPSVPIFSYRAFYFEHVCISYYEYSFPKFCLHANHNITVNFMAFIKYHSSFWCVLTL